jgi:hypothetical protein
MTCLYSHDCATGQVSYFKQVRWGTDTCVGPLDERGELAPIDQFDLPLKSSSLRKRPNPAPTPSPMTDGAVRTRRQRLPDDIPTIRSPVCGDVTTIGVVGMDEGDSSLAALAHAQNGDSSSI